MIDIHQPLPSAIDRLMLVFPWFGTNISLIPAIALIVWWLWSNEERTSLSPCEWQSCSSAAGCSIRRSRDVTTGFGPDLFPRRGWYGWTSYPMGHAIASVSVLITVAIVLAPTEGLGVALST
jgi:hypothetical protein